MSIDWDSLLGAWVESDDDVEGELSDVKLQSVSSSNLAAVGYNKDSYQLVIAFLDGSVYRYYGVPEDEYFGLMRADSHGEYFVDNIRLEYEYERILG